MTTGACVPVKQSVLTIINLNFKEVAVLSCFLLPYFFSHYLLFLIDFTIHSCHIPAISWFFSHSPFLYSFFTTASSLSLFRLFSIVLSLSGRSSFTFSLSQLIPFLLSFFLSSFPQSSWFPACSLVYLPSSSLSARYRYRRYCWWYLSRGSDWSCSSYRRTASSYACKNNPSSYLSLTYEETTHAVSLMGCSECYY